MRRALALALLLSAALSVPAPAQERILQFISDVQVQQNGDLLVTETIRVQAEGREIRRGILRDFPTTYRRADGSRVVVGFEVRSVSRNGAAENFVTEKLSNGVRIRIGSADRLIQRGPHTYVIAYRTTRQIGFFRDYDELYWNATGTGWTFAIDEAEARIALPANVPFRRNALYTGPQGARGQDARIVEQRPGLIVFRTSRPLPPRNGLTVAAGWEKGVVAQPTQAQLTQWWVDDHFPVVLGGLGLIVLLGYYALAWFVVGRDPTSGPVIPLFAPPNDMSAAAVRYVRRMGFDDRCFAAAIADLGVNGHLTLTGRDDSTTVTRRSGGRHIGFPEHAAAAKLFAGRQSVRLEQTNHKILGDAKSALEEGLADAYYRRLFHTNTPWSIVGLIGAVALVVATAIVAESTYGQGPHTIVMVFGTVIAMVGTASAAGLISAWMRAGETKLRYVVGAVIVGAVIFAGLAMVVGAGTSPVDMVAALPPVAAAGIAPLGFYLLKAPTREGRRIMDGIEGFRQYLGVAEEERLQFLHPPEKTPQLFEKFLPHAIALDVENAWAARFAGVLAAAAAAGVASTWYSGTGQYDGNPVRFAERLGGSLSSTIASASSPPGSSNGGGSGGGGSSGGGGGGGGGSGW